MNAVDDEMTRRLAHLDPVQRDPAPIPGTQRYNEIQERAMTMPTDTHGSLDTTEVKAARGGKSPQRARLVRYLAVAASAAAAVAAVVVLAPGQTESAEATVASAATATGQVESLRGTLTKDDFNSSSATVTIEYNDGDARLVGDSEEGEYETVVIGNRMYEEANGETQVSTIEPKAKLAPYGASAASVINAAVTSAEVEEQGIESTGGVDATHYVITLDAASKEALGELSPRELAWFELEYPDEVSQIDVWVADDLIHKVVVHVGQGTATTEFYDFGADIDIQPPAWSADR